MAKLKAKHRNRRIEVEFEVDQNLPGVTWKVMLRRTGRLALDTSATTMAPGGSFSVERRLTNGPGRDQIKALATSPAGEVCSARLTI